MHMLMAMATAGGGINETPSITGLADPLTSTVIGSGGDRPQVSFRFNSDGTIDEATGDTGSALSYTEVGSWLNNQPPNDSSDWEVRVTIDAEDIGDPGTFTGSATGSFLVLSSNRTWTWTKDANDLGTAGAEVTIDVRQVSDTGNSDTRSAQDLDCIISS